MKTKNISNDKLKKDALISIAVVINTWVREAKKGRNYAGKAHKQIGDILDEFLNRFKPEIERVYHQKLINKLKKLEGKKSDMEIIEFLNSLKEEIK